MSSPTEEKKCQYCDKIFVIPVELGESRSKKLSQVRYHRFQCKHRLDNVDDNSNKINNNSNASLDVEMETTTTTSSNHERKRRFEQKSNVNESKQTVIEQLGNILPASYPLVFDVDTSLLSKNFPYLTNYELFAQVQADSRGVAVRYNLNEDQSGYTIDTSQSERIYMKVGEWNAWLQEYRTFLRTNPNKLYPSLLYLTDIELFTDKHQVTQEIRKHVDAVGFCDEFGSFSQAYWLKQFDPEFATPNMAGLFYLSPPSMGFITTPPHLDGGGTQTSVHLVLMGGDNSYNLVHTWSSSQDFLGNSTYWPVKKFFLDIAQIPSQSLELPHNTSYESDLSQTHWHSKRQQELESMGCFGKQVKLRKGQVIVLPQGLWHTFKKSAQVNTNEELAAEEPLLGFAGDSSYIGNSAESSSIVVRNVSYMIAEQEQQRQSGLLSPGKIYGSPLVFCIISCLLLFKSPLLRQRKQAILNAKSCLPIVNTLFNKEKQLVTKLQTVLTSKSKSSKKDTQQVENKEVQFKQKDLDSDSVSLDYLCTRCHSYIANMFASDTSISSHGTSFLCLDCLASDLPIGPNSFIHFRFVAPAEFEKLLTDTVAFIAQSGF